MNREEMIAKLNAKIPRSVVREREGSGGKSFSYLEGHYVIDQMNQIFGQGNWAYMTEEIRCVHTGTVEGKYGPSHTAHYIAKVRVEVPALGHAIFVDVGYGDGSDKQNPGKAHELAAKEAVTDALKRSCKSLGMALGLALYDKEQTNVAEADEEKVASRKGDDKAAKGNSAPVAPKGDTVGRVRSEPKAAAPANDPAPDDKRKLLELVKATYKVVIAKAGADKEQKTADIKAHLKSEYGADKSDQLTEEQLSAFLAVLKNMLKGE